jgi:hypothetical protein
MKELFEQYKTAIVQWKNGDSALLHILFAKHPWLNADEQWGAAFAQLKEEGRI